MKKHAQPVLAEVRGAMSEKGSYVGARVLTLSCVLASLIIISCCITLITCIALSSPGLHLHRSTLSRITLACHASFSPQACQSSLSLSPPATTPAGLVAIAASFARKRLQICHSLSQDLILPTESQNPSLAGTVQNCEYLLRRALLVIEKCIVYMMEDNDTISSSFMDTEYFRAAHMMGAHVDFTKLTSGFTKIKDMEAWMSAALTWENDCYSALGYVNGTTMGHHGGHTGGDPKHSSHHGVYTSTDATYTVDHARHAMDPINDLMQHINIAIALTSNALSMLDAYDTYGSNMSAWRPPSKRSLPGFQNVELSDERRWHVYDIKGLVPTVTVSKDGFAAYSSIQAAVDDAPENASERFVIYIKQGIYKETVRVPYTKPFITFVGDGMGKTIITGNLNAQMPGVSTYDTATRLMGMDF